MAANVQGTSSSAAAAAASQQQQQGHSSSSSSGGGASNVVGTHYRVGKKIGEGSFGVIFEGPSKALSPSASLPSLASDSSRPSAFPHVERRLAPAPLLVRPACRRAPCPPPRSSRSAVQPWTRWVKRRPSSRGGGAHNAGARARAIALPPDLLFLEGERAPMRLPVANKPFTFLGIFRAVPFLRGLSGLGGGWGVVCGCAARKGGIARGPVELEAQVGGSVVPSSRLLHRLLLVPFLRSRRRRPWSWLSASSSG